VVAQDRLGSAPAKVGLSLLTRGHPGRAPRVGPAVVKVPGLAWPPYGDCFSFAWAAFARETEIRGR
jgi:hypothetical protein